MGGKRALYLQGGGAKGAWQAGVLCGWLENGQRFDWIGGTSIGAVNAWMLHCGGPEALRRFWTHLPFPNAEASFSTPKIFENQMLMDSIGTKGCNRNFEHVWVNYVTVVDGRPVETVADLAQYDEHEAHQIIGWSACLPRPESLLRTPEDMRGVTREAIASAVDEAFRAGEYNGMKLDGSLGHLEILDVMIDRNPSELTILALKSTGIPLEKLEPMIAAHGIILKYQQPVTAFKSFDTFRFEPDVCGWWFEEGYQFGKGEMVQVF